ncbi:metal ABC transporter permease [Salinispirillum sp. LH 10-3-1]|uniref:High-affinity zinc uptake system membrane protein ZnuB n=1 Tax=Salinispirillum sp. LH 10-3-1 TaxID=2952525 RepID=A0AB38YHJ8_9GAMM
MTELWLFPLVAGCGLMLLAGPFGSLLVWQRMAFFGDALAHASLLGVGIGLFWQWTPAAGALLGTLAFALILWRAERITVLASDTWLGVLSHGSLALGLLVVYGLVPNSANVNGLLIGDLLSVGINDLLLLAVLLVVGWGWLFWRWRSLMLFILSPELAQAEGINVSALRGQFMVLLAAIVALAMQWVGVLLISALLLIPAAAARPLSREPEHMALLATLIGVLSVCAGIASSWYWDWPTGPAIVVMALAGFVVLWSGSTLSNKR